MQMKPINECLMMLKKDEQMELACQLGLDKLRQSARKADGASYIEKGMLAEPERVRMLLRRDWIKAVRKKLAEGNAVAADVLKKHGDLVAVVVELERCGLV